MLVTTKGIVISKLRYQDNDLIVRCYTKHFGIQSYLLRGVLKSRKGKLKTAYFQELSQLQLTVNYNEKRSLQSIREVRSDYLYKSIYENVTKSAIVLFLAEILANILREEESNDSLYSYLETTLLWLDENDSISNFHLLFLLKLTKFLGFYPETYTKNEKYFNLQEGAFSNERISQYCISGEKLELLITLLGTNFDELNAVHFNSYQRQDFIKFMLMYYDLHLGTLKQPKSLQILNQVFS